MKKFLLKTKSARVLILGLCSIMASQALYAAQGANHRIEHIHDHIDRVLKQRNSHLIDVFNEERSKYLFNINHFLDLNNHITFAEFKNIITESVNQYIANVLDPMIAHNDYAEIRGYLIAFKTDLINFAGLIKTYNGKSATVLGFKLYKSYNHMMPLALVEKNGGQLGLVKRLGHRLRCCGGQGCRA